MHAALLFALLPCLFAAGGDLRALEDELARVAALAPESGAPEVGDARLAQLEAALGRHLGLPPELAVALTAPDGARREVLADGAARVAIARRAEGTRLFELEVSLDGERVRGESLTFCDPLGVDPRTRAIVDHHNLRHYPLERLPWLFRRVQTLLASIDSRGARVLAVQPVNAWFTTRPPVPECFFEVAYGSGEQRRVGAYTLLPLGPTLGRDGELLVPVDRDGRLVERIERALRRTPETALAEAEQVLAGLRGLALEHRVVLHETPYEGRGFLLDLDRPAAPPGERRVAYVRVRRDERGAWRVSEWSGKRAERSLPLARFAALTDAALRRASGRGESLAALAVFAPEDLDSSEVLAVTSPTVPVWEAARATAHVLRVGDGGVPVTVASAQLLGFARVNPNPFRYEMQGRTHDGRVVSFATSSSTCGTELDPWPLARCGEREAELLGGNALGDRQDPRDRR